MKKKLYDMRKKLDFERSRTKSLVQDLQEHKKEVSCYCHHIQFNVSAANRPHQLSKVSNAV